jgi:hypothetical protein
MTTDKCRRSRRVSSKKTGETAQDVECFNYVTSLVKPLNEQCVTPTTVLFPQHTIARKKKRDLGRSSAAERLVLRHRLYHSLISEHLRLFFTRIG